MKITASNLKQIVPTINPDLLTVYPALLSEIPLKYNIDTPARMSCFLAQIAHESGSFKYTREIASGRAYEGRKDLGNIYPGDGVKFKGRGLIQVTGRTNYRACSLALFGDERLTKNPDILSTPTYAVESACWYWKSRGLNEICDEPDDWTITTHHPDGTVKAVYNKFQWLTIKINGGLNGYNERLHFYDKAKQVIQ